MKTHYFEIGETLASPSQNITRDFLIEKGNKIVDRINSEIYLFQGVGYKCSWASRSSATSKIRAGWIIREMTISDYQNEFGSELVTAIIFRYRSVKGK